MVVVGVVVVVVRDCMEYMFMYTHILYVVYVNGKHVSTPTKIVVNPSTHRHRPGP